MPFLDSFKKIVFRAEDVIDRIEFCRRVAQETLHIFSDTKRRGMRTHSEVFHNVVQGLTLEHLIAEKHPSYVLAQDTYHDLLNIYDGSYVELKAYSTADPNNFYIRREVSRLRFPNSKNQSKYLVVYSYANGLYEYLTSIKIR